MASDQFTLPLQQVQELANFWAEEGDAISFYFQPPVPSELSHREEPILAKEQIQAKLRTLQGNSPADREDIRRILDTVGELREERGRRTRVIFACARHKIWREHDVPADFGVGLDVGTAFTLGPLIAQQQSRKRYCIALADRNRARLLLLEAREIREHSQVLDEDDKKKVRTTGTRANNNLERKLGEQVRRHYQFLSDHLLHFHQHGDFDALLIGCRDEMWPAIEETLHPDIMRILVGRFLVDPGLATREEVAEKAQAFIDEKDRREEQELVEKVVGAAASEGLGAVGLNAVIDALEQGEVRTLLWSARRPQISISRSEGSPPGEQAGLGSASFCPNCGHLDATPANVCTLCGTQMHRFENAEEALLRHAFGRNIEVRMLHYSKLPPPDQIAARLRFLARHNTAQALAS